MMRLALTMVALLLVAGCGGDNGGPTAPSDTSVLGIDVSPSAAVRGRTDEGTVERTLQYPENRPEPDRKDTMRPLTIRASLPGGYPLARMRMGETLALQLEDDGNAIVTALNWGSAHADIVSVDNGGNVRPVEPGRGQIVASYSVADDPIGKLTCLFVYVEDSSGSVPWWRAQNHPPVAPASQSADWVANAWIAGCGRQ